MEKTKDNNFVRGYRSMNLFLYIHKSPWVAALEQKDKHETLGRFPQVES